MCRKLKPTSINIGTWVIIQTGQLLGMVGKVIAVAPATRNGATYYTYTIAITFDGGRRIAWIDYADQDIQPFTRSFEIQNHY